MNAALIQFRDFFNNEDMETLCIHIFVCTFSLFIYNGMIMVCFQALSNVQQLLVAWRLTDFSLSLFILLDILFPWIASFFLQR